MTQRFGVLDFLSCLLLAIVCCGVAMTTLGDWAVLTPDSFGYLGVARSLAELGALPAQQLTLPPGFSVLIAPLMWAGPAPLLSIRMMLIGGWAIGSILTFIYYRSELGRVWAFGTGLIVATSPAFLTQSACVLSELTFVPLVMASLVVMRSWYRGRRTGAVRVLFGSLLVAAAMMVRTMGVALVPVAIVMLLFRRGNSWLRRVALIVVFLLLPAAGQAAWSFRNSHYAAGYGYVQILTQPRAGEPADAGPMMLQLDRLTRYGPQRLGTIAEAVVPAHLGWRLLQPPLAPIAGWVIGAALLIVCGIRLFVHRSPADGFALMLFAILAVWPWDEGPRFVVPIVPIFAGSCVALIAGVRRGRRASPEPARRESSKREVTDGDGPQSAIRLVVATLAICAVLGVHMFEDSLIVESSVARRAKESQRVARMQLLATMLNDDVPIGSPLACVMPNESYAKTLAIGAAYFATRSIDKFRDLRDGESVDWKAYEGDYVVTIDSLGIESGWDRVLLPATDQAGNELVLLRPNHAAPTLNP